jgi:hypothetical protein
VNLAYVVPEVKEAHKEEKENEVGLVEMDKEAPRASWA